VGGGGHPPVETTVMRQLGAGQGGVVRTAAQTGLTSTETVQKAACQGREKD
jgi:hypothetical protein